MPDSHLIVYIVEIAMKLIYVYIENFRRFKDANLSFDSNWRFRVVKKSNGEKALELMSGKEDNVYAGFFSIAGVKKRIAKCPVSSMSAVIGDNGSGKTTIAAFLEHIRGGNPEFGYVVIVHFDGMRTDNSMGDLTCFTNIPSIQQQTSGWFRHPTASVNAQKAIASSFELVYFSPRYTIGSPFVLGDESVVCDLSTTHLIRTRAEKYYLGEVRNTRTLLGGYEDAERRQMITVSHAMRFERDKMARISIPVPTVRGIIMEWGREQLVLLIGFFDAQYKQHGLNREDKKEITKYRSVVRRISKALNDLKGYTSDFLLMLFVTMAGAYLREVVLRMKGQEQIVGLSDWLGDLFLEMLEKKFVPVYGTKLIFNMKTLAEYIEQHLQTQEEDRGCFWDNDEVLSAVNFLKLLEEKRFYLRNEIDGMPLPPFQRFISLASAEEREFFDNMVDLYSTISLAMDFVRWDFYPVLSSGEIALLMLYGRLYEFFQQRKSSGGDVLLFLDEAETTFHPDWQRRLVWLTIRFLEMFGQNRRTHVIFATHSPNILSDIPDGNVCRLSDIRQEDCLEVSNGKCFAANIFDLYYQQFGLTHGPLGVFSSALIRAVLRRLAPDLDNRVRGEDIVYGLNDDQCRAIINLIGDRFIKDYLNGKESERRGYDSFNNPRVD